MIGAISKIKRNPPLLFRHPFMVAEIFGCEVANINDIFFTAPPKSAMKTNEPKDLTKSSEKRKNEGGSEDSLSD